MFNPICAIKVKATVLFIMYIVTQRERLPPQLILKIEMLFKVLVIRIADQQIQHPNLDWTINFL